MLKVLIFSQTDKLEMESDFLRSVFMNVVFTFFFSMKNLESESGG